MRYYLLLLYVITGNLANAQVMLPAFQGLQAKASTVPVITTAAVAVLTSTTASSGGTIISNGGASVTAGGICWSTAANPTTALSTKTTDGTGTGSFSSSLTGLTSGTVYYVRAYATNSVGTAYGTQVSFIAVAVGDSYQGGIMAYSLAPGDPGYDADNPHGLIAAASDQSSAEWGCWSTNIAGANGTAIGTGLQNTIAIMAGCPTAVIAARLCRGVTINGYSDWYLPSKDELNKLYLNRLLIGGFNLTGWYFSSTQYDSYYYYAWHQDFSNGNQAPDWKDWSLGVRAVRSF